MPLLVDNDQETVEYSPILTDRLAELVDNLLQNEGVDSAAEVSLLFTDDRRIAELNEQYRGKSGPTDVLSFAMREQIEEEPELDNPAVDLLLGDVVISVETAKRQSEEYGHSLEREIAYLLIHGVLHLLGYSHEQDESRRKMREKEEQILVQVGLLR